MTEGLRAEAEAEEKLAEAERLAEGYRRQLEGSNQRLYKAQFECRARTQELADAQRRVAEAEAEVAFLDRPAHDDPVWLHDKHNKSHHATPLLGISDWHIGETVDPDEMDGCNAFNNAIAAVRAHEYFEGVYKLLTQYVAGRTYDGLVIAMTGDIVSGGIHDELAETDEGHILEQARYAKNLILPGIRMLVAEFQLPIHIVAAPGNHGRMDKRSHYKHRGGRNADIHIAKLLRDDCELLGLKDVTFDVAEGISVNFQIYDTVFKAEHFDEARGGNGVAGVLAPLPRLVLRRKQQAQQEQALKRQWVEDENDKPFDCLIGGHFHQQIDLRGQGFVMTGCLKGYDEFAKGKGFAPERPQQGIWICTPERGITDFIPVHVDNKKKEGW